MAPRRKTEARNADAFVDNVLGTRTRAQEIETMVLEREPRVATFPAVASYLGGTLSVEILTDLRRLARRPEHEAPTRLVLLVLVMTADAMFALVALVQQRAHDPSTPWLAVWLYEIQKSLAHARAVADLGAMTFGVGGYVEQKAQDPAYRYHGGSGARAARKDLN